MKKNKNNQKNTTKYDEFVPTYFAWLTPKFQKDRSKKLNDMTKNKK